MILLGKVIVFIFISRLLHRAFEAIKYIIFNTERLCQENLLFFFSVFIHQQLFKEVLL